MTYTANPTTDEHPAKQQNQYREAASPSQQTPTLHTPSSSLLSLALLGNGRLSGRAGGSMRAAAFQAMQQTHGNRAVQRHLQRSTSRQAIPVQRWGLDDIWDTVRNAGSTVGEALLGAKQPTLDQAPVGPVVGPDNMWPVGPVIGGDNIAVPGYEPYV
jgi:hypothetical protein